jgi:septum site-determining protein MinD
MDDTCVFAVASGKGGVGKTTTAVALGTCAAAAGLSAVVVDADLGMGNLGSVVGAERPDTTLHDVLAGDAEVDAAPRPVEGDLDVVPGGFDLDAYADADPSELGSVVADLRERYDVVLVDTGAGLSHDTVLPLGVADEVVLVTTAETIAVDNAATTLAVADRLDASVRGVVVTRAVGETADEAVADLDVPLLGTVPEDDAVGRAADAGTPLTAYDPQSPAAGAYADVAATLFDVPVTDLSFGEGEATDFDANPAAESESDVSFGRSDEDADGDESGDANADEAEDGDGAGSAETDGASDGEAPSDDDGGALGPAPLDRWAAGVKRQFLTSGPTRFGHGRTGRSAAVGTAVRRRHARWSRGRHPVRRRESGRTSGRSLPPPVAVTSTRARRCRARPVRRPARSAPPSPVAGASRASPPRRRAPGTPGRTC